MQRKKEQGKHTVKNDTESDGLGIPIATTVPLSLPEASRSLYYREFEEKNKQVPRTNKKMLRVSKRVEDCDNFSLEELVKQSKIGFLSSRRPGHSRKITLISSPEEWETKACYQITKDIEDFPVLGFKVGGFSSAKFELPQESEDVSAKSVSLQDADPGLMIHFSTLNANTFLIRIGLMDQIPKTLKKILQDPGILKVGVGVVEATERLWSYKADTTSVVDLRNVVMHHKILPTLHPGQRDTLKVLAEKCFGKDVWPFSPNAMKRLARSSALESLTHDQITYAAFHSQISMDLLGFCCMGLCGSLMVDEWGKVDGSGGFERRWVHKAVEGIIDQDYSALNLSNDGATKSNEDLRCVQDPPHPTDNDDRLDTCQRCSDGMLCEEEGMVCGMESCMGRIVDGEVMDGGRLPLSVRKAVSFLTTHAVSREKVAWHAECLISQEFKNCVGKKNGVVLVRKSLKKRGDGPGGFGTSVGRMVKRLRSVDVVKRQKSPLLFPAHLRLNIPHVTKEVWGGGGMVEAGFLDDIRLESLHDPNGFRIHVQLEVGQNLRLGRRPRVKLVSPQMQEEEQGHIVRSDFYSLQKRKSGEDSKKKARFLKNVESTGKFKSTGTRREDARRESQKMPSTETMTAVSEKIWQRCLAAGKPRENSLDPQPWFLAQEHTMESLPRRCFRLMREGWEKPEGELEEHANTWTMRMQKAKEYATKAWEDREECLSLHHPDNQKNCPTASGPWISDRKSHEVKTEGRRDHGVERSCESLYPCWSCGESGMGRILLETIAPLSYTQFQVNVGLFCDDYYARLCKECVLLWRQRVHSVMLELGAGLGASLEVPKWIHPQEYSQIKEAADVLDRLKAEKKAEEDAQVDRLKAKKTEKASKFLPSPHLNQQIANKTREINSLIKAVKWYEAPINLKKEELVKDFLKKTRIVFNSRLDFHEFLVMTKMNWDLKRVCKIFREEFQAFCMEKSKGSFLPETFSVIDAHMGIGKPLMATGEKPEEDLVHAGTHPMEGKIVPFSPATTKNHEPGKSKEAQEQSRQFHDTKSDPKVSETSGVTLSGWEMAFSGSHVSGSGKPFTQKSVQYSALHTGEETLSGQEGGPKIGPLAGGAPSNSDVRRRCYAKLLDGTVGDGDEGRKGEKEGTLKETLGRMAERQTGIPLWSGEGVHVPALAGRGKGYASGRGVNIQQARSSSDWGSGERREESERGRGNGRGTSVGAAFGRGFRK